MKTEKKLFKKTIHVEKVEGVVVVVVVLLFCSTKN
jgi:hypothetical protein